LPEFNVTILTIRSGTHSLRVEAENAASARDLIQANPWHCPPEWCCDDVDSNVTDVRPVETGSDTGDATKRVVRGAAHADHVLLTTELRHA